MRKMRIFLFKVSEHVINFITSEKLVREQDCGSYAYKCLQPFSLLLHLWFWVATVHPIIGYHFAIPLCSTLTWATDDKLFILPHWCVVFIHLLLLPCCQCLQTGRESKEGVGWLGISNTEVVYNLDEWAKEKMICLLVPSSDWVKQRYLFKELTVRRLDGKWVSLMP